MAAPDNVALQMVQALAQALGPLSNVVSVTPDNANDLPFKPRAIHVSVAGNISYTANGVTVTEAFEIGWHPIRPDRIRATGTTATMTAWW